ncbi:MAG: ABC transporter permease [Gemmataceae bacterium]
MRWYILRTLLHKELLRHGANRGGIFLVVLLMAASLLLSFFGGKDLERNTALTGVKRCYIEYKVDDDFVDHLYRNVPAELEGRVRFRNLASVRTNADGTPFYVQNAGAIQIHNGQDNNEVQIWFWEPGQGSLSSYEIWLWREIQNYTNKQKPPASTSDLPDNENEPIPIVFKEPKRSFIKGGLDPRSGIATALAVFGLFFVCVYLMPSLSCEERERGILLAQALSPASPKEILRARFLFYPVLAIFLVCVLAGSYRPVVLLSGYFWLALLTATAGSMGVGLTIASVAKTQREASMGALAYMFVVTLFLFVCQQIGATGLSYVAMEFHVPRMFHAVLSDAVTIEHWGSVLMMFIISSIWVWVAVKLFRRQGWQT